MKQLIAMATAMMMVAMTCSVCHAEIHKCTGAVFTDKPCPDGGGTTIASRPEVNVAKIDFRTKTRTYTVRGATYQQVLAAMRSAGPFQAWARWAVAFNFAPKTAGSACTIDKLNIAIAGEILMPEWAELSSAKAQDYNAWEGMYSILKTHEDGHIKHGEEFAILLREKLLGIGSQPCEKLQLVANQTSAQLTENLKRRDADYDFRTEHGLRQFNPR